VPCSTLPELQVGERTASKVDLVRSLHRQFSLVSGSSVPALLHQRRATRKFSVPTNVQRTRRGSPAGSLSERPVFEREKRSDEEDSDDDDSDFEEYPYEYVTRCGRSKLKTLSDAW